MPLLAKLTAFWASIHRKVKVTAVVQVVAGVLLLFLGQQTTGETLIGTGLSTLGIGYSVKSAK